jgi:hypothetical protein
MDADKFAKLDAALKAAELWNSMTDNERHGIRFGLFPAKIMEAAAKEGFNARELCVALMNCAKKDGGMRA